MFVLNPLYHVCHDYVITHPKLLLIFDVLYIHLFHLFSTNSGLLNFGESFQKKRQKSDSKDCISEILEFFSLFLWMIKKLIFPEEAIEKNVFSKHNDIFVEHSKKELKERKLDLKWNNSNNHIQNI